MYIHLWYVLPVLHRFYSRPFANFATAILTSCSHGVAIKCVADSRTPINSTQKHSHTQTHTLVYTHAVSHLHIIWLASCFKIINCTINLW